MGKRVVQICLLLLFVFLCSSCFGQTIIRVKPDGNNANDGSTWALAKKTMQAGIDSANSSGGGEIWVAAGTYNESITLKTSCYVYGGFVGTEDQRSERNFGANKSIIDGSGDGDVVSVEEISTTTCIDGFLITNSGIGSVGGYCGIHCWPGSSPEITNNTISGNANGISCASSSNAIISNNIIRENSIYGIDCNSSPVIANNTILENYSSGIITRSSAANPIIINNIIAYNTNGIDKYAGNMTVKKNCVYGNTTNYNRTTAEATDIVKDPLLENWRYGKVHIQPGSPCIDAGDSSIVVDSWVDMDGQPRKQGASVDIGADESDGTLWALKPLLIYYVSPDGNDSNDGSSWALAKKTVQAGIDAAYNNSGGEVWVAAGTYNEHIYLKASCDIYGGFSGNEQKRSERNYSLNQSIIDSSASENVVSSMGIGTTARIDGFTIRNGGSNCYGVYCLSGSSPTIANNTITGNKLGVLCNIAGNPVIEFNAITENSGDGIRSVSTNSAVNNNIIRDNNGYGLYHSGATAELTISNNTVTGNSGSGLSCTSSRLRVADNIVCNNGLDGIYYASSKMIIGNTICGNGRYGISCRASLQGTNINNNIVAFNNIGIYKDNSGFGGTLKLKNNCVYGSNTADYSATAAGTTDISKDPLFRDRLNGDYHLLPNSPCVNAGDDSVVDSGWLDMDLEPRIMGSHTDIGADEFTYSVLVNNAKRCIDSAYVQLKDMVVSSVFDGFYYVQDKNRSCGIRVDQISGSLPSVNSVISMKGTISTTADGERCLVSSETPAESGKQTIPSIMAVCKSIGGGDYFYSSTSKTGQKGVLKGFGLNNIGLLLTVCGKVTSIDTVAKRIYINDGSADVAVYYGSITLPESVSIGKLIRATGASSCYKLENGDLGRLILLRDADSISAVN